jgi:hypothetical protein
MAGDAGGIALLCAALDRTVSTSHSPVVSCGVDASAAQRGQHQASSGETEHFDAVVIATHSDQALRLPADPNPREQDILGAIPLKFCIAPFIITPSSPHAAWPRNKDGWRSTASLIPGMAVLTGVMDSMKTGSTARYACINILNNDGRRREQLSLCGTGATSNRHA